MEKEGNKQAYRVTVLDMQPIEPPVGGGRLRLIGLYHALGNHLPTTYVGTYDWPGEAFRDHYITENLREITIPLSDAHFAASDRIKNELGGKTVIDSTFHKLAHLSPDYVKRAREETRNADIVFFSHPWIYPLVRQELDRSRQLVVYDSQNVEGYLRAQLLDDAGGKGSRIARGVIEVEYDLCHFAHLTLACSHEDRRLFNKLYQLPFENICVVPNGTFTRKRPAITTDQKPELKRKLSLTDRPLAVFLASAYPPNAEAAHFILDHCAPALPEITFAICGGVGGSIAKVTQENVVVTGPLTEEKKCDYLGAADVAINPMFSGSGTNIKIFDFLAMSLPVVTTTTGARGVEQGPFPCLKICEREGFVEGLRSLINDERERRRLACGGRQLVERLYSWERISADLGRLVTRLRQRLNREQPVFSVVIPTYERHHLCSEVARCLERQEFRDFEVIIVDQSEKPWPDHSRNWAIDLHYLHTDVKGVVSARNRAAYHARGKYLAFTDDDCRPEPDWLSNAAKHLRGNEVIGLEGRIWSGNLNERKYRTVTNRGLTGIGFMTANLFLERRVFNAINGFDYAFDPTPFREDSDLGWRALEYGRIDYSDKVVVYHPPHSRDQERESQAARDTLFQKDPLLLQKHPMRYRQLFLMEDHWQQTEGFWKNFFLGAEIFGVEVPRWILLYFAQVARKAAIRQS